MYELAQTLHLPGRFAFCELDIEARKRVHGLLGFHLGPIEGKPNTLCNSKKKCFAQLVNVAQKALEQNFDLDEFSSYKDVLGCVR
jgi:hypothetical protein